MANTIKIKSSGTSSSVPLSLEYGELALNYADGKLFYRNSADQIVDIGDSIVNTMTGGTTLSSTPPSSPTAGSLWFNIDTAKMYIYYDDGTSSQWVEVGGAGGSVSSVNSSTDGAIMVMGVYP